MTKEIIKEIQNGKTLRLIQDDISKRRVDAIVNPANSHLQHGAGVAGVIVRKGGDIIQKESNKIGFVPVGSAVMTSAGKLPCKAVIHTVGPRMGERNEDNKLKNAVKNSLALASSEKFQSVSIPAISTGIFGFPKDRCAEILVSETVNFIHKNPQSSLELIEFCVYDEDAFSYFSKQLELL